MNDMINWMLKNDVSATGTYTNFSWRHVHIFGTYNFGKIIPHQAKMVSIECLFAREKSFHYVKSNASFIESENSSTNLKWCKASYLAHERETVSTACFSDNIEIFTNKTAFHSNHIEVFGIE